MDPKLAEIYGTNQPSQDDVEKLAAAELAEELSENDEANIDGMSDEQIEALAEQVLAGEGGEEQEQSESQAEETDEDPEAMEKISEADYLGRVMAHSYVNELRNIDAEMQKEAGARMDAAKAAVKGAAGKVGGFLKQHKGKIGIGAGVAAAGGAGYAAGKHQGKKEKTSGARLDSAKAAVKGAAGKVGAHIGRNKKKYIGGAAAATAAGGAALAYKKHKSKQSSALDTLAEARALEILAENGIDPNAEVETEKVSGAEQEVLAQAVEQRAFDMLAEAGYISDESEGSEE